MLCYLLSSWPYIDPPLQWLEVITHSAELAVFLLAMLVMNDTANKSVSWIMTGGGQAGGKGRGGGEVVVGSWQGGDRRGGGDAGVRW